MKADDPLVEVLLRNEQYWAGKKVLFAGDITSPQLLPQLIRTTAATVLTDNYEFASSLSAMMGVRLGHSAREFAQKKHVQVIFGSCHDPQVVQHLESVETLVLFLSKSKSLSQDLLYHLQSKLTDKTNILLIGANAIGGKSADSLLKNAATVYKVDTARKCTVFLGQLKAPQADTATGITLPALKPCKAIPAVRYGGISCEQLPGIFSQGQLDNGTHMLLNALHADLTAQALGLSKSENITDLATSDLTILPPLNIAEPILDLGCGAGVIGLSLAARGCSHIVSTDISATALFSTELNASKEQLSKRILPLACDMLPQEATLEAAQSFMGGSNKFRFIVTNPPFHQGLNRSTSKTLDMIAHAPEYLSANGALYLVGNTCLHYEQALEQAFKRVEVLYSTTKFTVFKAQMA